MISVPRPACRSLDPARVCGDLPVCQAAGESPELETVLDEIAAERATGRVKMTSKLNRPEVGELAFARKPDGRCFDGWGGGAVANHRPGPASQRRGFLARNPG